MPTPTRLRPNRRAAFDDAARRLGAFILILISCGALVAGVRHLLASGSFISRVHVDNASEYGIDVRVKDKPAAASMTLGTAQPNTRTTVEDVYDQGRTWVFDFSYGPFERSIQMPQRELQRSGWVVQVPQELIRQLRAAHVPPTPVPTGP